MFYPLQSTPTASLGPSFQQFSEVMVMLYLDDAVREAQTEAANKTQVSWLPDTLFLPHPETGGHFRAVSQEIRNIHNLP